MQQVQLALEQAYRHVYWWHRAVLGGHGWRLGNTEAHVFGIGCISKPNAWVDNLS
jgi:hypothetical protein